MDDKRLSKPKTDLPADVEKLRRLKAYAYRNRIAPYIIHFVDETIKRAQRENLVRIGVPTIAKKFGLSGTNVGLLVEVRAEKLGVKLNLKRGGPNYVRRRK